MTRHLDLADIQGNVLRAYGKFGFPKARYFFLHIADAAAGRAFVDKIRGRVTNSENWRKGASSADENAVPVPKVTLNVGFTWRGLLALDLPTRTLRAMPDEFIDGMQRRADILGDVGPNAPDKWDAIWQRAAQEPDGEVHVWISMNAQMTEDGAPVEELEQQTRWLRGLVDDSKGGIALLSGHGPERSDYQDASALLQQVEGRLMPSPKEHFGFTDGIGDPVFEGRYAEAVEKRRVIGRGKLLPDQTWDPLATGEFILGHPDESQELPPASPPPELTRNGTFMAYRKLHENVGSFHGYIAEAAKRYAQVMGVSEAEADATIRAKMVGRWADGVPLMAAPTYEDWQKLLADWKDIPEIAAKSDRTPQEQARLNEFRLMLIDFVYRDDVEGTKCPVTAHIRRANTRDMLDPTLKSDPSGSALNKRRRIMRRGLPYGSWSKDAGDDGEHGIIFMAVCGSLFRQFEFVQQQWIQYGLDFNVGNDTCPLVGGHGPGARFVIAADPASGKPPFICADMPTFVTTRGGDYFFIPSLTALRMIAQGTVDPT